MCLDLGNAQHVPARCTAFSYFCPRTTPRRTRCSGAAWTPTAWLPEAPLPVRPWASWRCPLLSVGGGERREWRSGDGARNRRVLSLSEPRKETPRKSVDRDATGHRLDLKTRIHLFTPLTTTYFSAGFPARVTNVAVPKLPLPNTLTRRYRSMVG